MLFLITAVLLAFCSSSDDPVDSETLEQKIAQMLMVGFRGMEVDAEHWVVKDITERGLGGVILFDYDVPSATPERNVESFEQVQQLVSDLKSYSSQPLLVAIDQEGGRVNRLKTRFGFPPTVSHEYLGDLNNPDSTRHYAAQTAGLLDDLGININFAPVVDLNTNPENPIIGQLERSFSDDPDIVTLHASIFLEEHRDRGIFGTAKHFPGHGSTWNDSHHGLADVTDTWDEIELLPYINLVQDNKLDIVMSAHIFNEAWDDQHPATLVSNVMTDMLRGDIGFNGVLVSDDMQMGAITEFYGLETAIRLAVNAGIDLLIFANNSVYDPEITGKAIDIIRDMVETGEIPRQRITESVERINTLRQRLN